MANIKLETEQITSTNALCSCCLELSTSKGLWTQYICMGQTEVYGQMLADCFNISWAHRDDKICDSCIMKLKSAVQFKQRVLQSHSLLEQQALSTLEIPIKAELQAKYEEDIDDDIQFDVNYNDDSIEEPNILCDAKSKTPPRKKKKLDGQRANYLKARQNVCLILEHSTIVPFKSINGHFNCLYCSKQFVLFDELRQHSHEIHQNLDFETIVKSITRPCERIRADISNITCKLCINSFDNLEIFVSHLFNEHSVVFNSDDERKPENSIIGYDLSGGKFKCCQCKEEFLFFRTLTKHMNVHSSGFVCDICGRSFLLPDRLRSHRLVHSQKKQVKCDECGKVYTSIFVLRNHIRCKHNKTAYKCTICGTYFDNLRQRSVHLEEVHNRSVNLTCKVCSKKFNATSSLNKHIRVEHLKMIIEAKHGCEECGMRFKSRYELTDHMIVHSSEKNFECEVCHKRYARLKTLREHLKIHSNDKRWACGACSQAFVQKCSLKNHIRVHHGELSVEETIVYKKPDDK